jgi:hypothetical protein
MIDLEPTPKTEPFVQTYEYPFRPDTADLDDYQPSEWWHSHPASAKQIEALERRGYGPPPRLTKGEAAFVLGLPTPKQRHVLERRGRWRDGMTFEQARDALDEIAREEGWGR